jgi:2-hydroxychromene-2-carboxylate isomerase
LPRAIADRLVRRTLPRAVVAGSRVTLPARLGAQARRRSGGRERVELFFAFDDPCSAVAVLDLAARLASRPVDLILMPVVKRGIAGAPAAALKRDYAITDARRLARRGGLALARQAPLDAAEGAFLAEWVAGGEPGAALLGFTTAAIRRLWFESATVPDPRSFLDLWQRHMQGDPAPDASAVRACERRMARRGPYDTPAAWVAGRWYFAHDRGPQICEWLDALGWAPR